MCMTMCDYGSHFQPLQADFKYLEKSQCIFAFWRVLMCHSHTRCFVSAVKSVSSWSMMNLCLFHFRLCGKEETEMQCWRGGGFVRMAGESDDETIASTRTFQ